MAITAQQFNQLGIPLFYLTPEQGYTGGWYAIENGIAKQVDSQAGEYLKSIGVPVNTRPASQGVPSNTVGGSTITLNSLQGSVDQTRVRQEQAQEEQRVQLGNAAIKSGNVAEVEKYFPGYTLWNGAFVQKSLVPQLQAEGATVSGGNVVGPAVPGLNAPTINGQQDSTYPQGGSGTPPQLTELPDLAKQALDSMYSKGYVLNPNSDLSDPRTVSEFLKIAENEIAPFYKNKFTVAREQFLRTQGYSSDQLNEFESNLERQYGQQVRDIAAQAGEVGFAQSGKRRLEEQNLATDVQGRISQNRAQLSYQGGNRALEFGGQYGASNIPTGTLSNVPRVLAGTESFERPNGQSPYYQLSNDIMSAIQTGTEQFQERGDIQRRQLELEEASRLGQSLPRIL